MTCAGSQVGAAPSPGGRLHVTTSWGDDEAVVVVAGEVDVAAAPVLRNALQDVAARSRSDVVIDAASIEFIDAAGVGVILGSRRRLALAGRHLIVRDPSSPVRRVLVVLGLDDLLEGAAG